MTDRPSAWQGKTVLITGGAGGMGLAFAERYIGAGACVALADLDAERAGAAAKRLGERCLAIASDVTRVSDCARMVDETLARFGRLDPLINAAGIWVEGPAETMSEAMWDRCLDINLKGTFFACRYAIPALEKTEGSILNIASDAGLMGNKSAMDMLSPLIKDAANSYVSNLTSLTSSLGNLKDLQGVMDFVKKAEPTVKQLSSDYQTLSATTGEDRSNLLAAFGPRLNSANSGFLDKSSAIKSNGMWGQIASPVLDKVKLFQ